jgi:hypothetical protein
VRTRILDGKPCPAEVLERLASVQTADVRGRRGRQPLIHYESLGLETPDHDVNVVSSFHPPPFV